MKYFKNLQVLLVLSCFVFMAGCKDSVPKHEITIYKSYTCNCCNGWQKHMEKNGYRFEVVNMAEREVEAIKRKYAIPRALWSCHTAVVENYVIEGHVPAKVVDKLLVEKPDVDGIALSGMPAGSPGMPGKKTEKWDIYSIKEGRRSLYMRF